MNKIQNLYRIKNRDSVEGGIAPDTPSRTDNIRSYQVLLIQNVFSPITVILCIQNPTALIITLKI